ncbi:MAG TPA: hypothetical protein PLQ98_01880, partial [Bacillota bacterium]|nr:hypothetical protein [Bacillota bacterium]
NGKSYEVTVSEKSGSPVVEKVSEAVVKEEPTLQATGTPVVAPMGGLVKDILVKVGDKVEDGTVVAIVEVMKMDTEVTAESAGVVESIQVAKGDNLDSGATIMTIK